MRMLTAFPTARGLARYMQQAATDQRNGALTGKVGTALTVFPAPAMGLRPCRNRRACIVLLA